MDGESSTIYGLDYHARTLCSVAAEQDKVQFLVGTQSLRTENQVCLLELDEDSEQVRKTAFTHDRGELWFLAPSLTDSHLLATVYSGVNNDHLNVGSALWRLDLGEGASDTPLLEHLSTFTPPPDHPPSNIACLEWQPGGRLACILHDAAFSLLDMEASGEEMKVTSSGGSTKTGAPRYSAGKWDPHHSSNVFLAAQDSSLHAFDLRSPQEYPPFLIFRYRSQPMSEALRTAYSLESAHSPTVRDVDFNPNRQYVVATAGDDAAIRIWDTRQPSLPLQGLYLLLCNHSLWTELDVDDPSPNPKCGTQLQTLNEHSHWVWRIRYNPVHDQLLLSGSSDARVLLHCLCALSSESGLELEEGVLRRVEEHEESVYALDWSTADPWTAASLSYDGRVIITKLGF